VDCDGRDIVEADDRDDIVVRNGSVQRPDLVAFIVVLRHPLLRHPRPRIYSWNIRRQAFLREAASVPVHWQDEPAT
jgi:hypothetical protein